MMIAADITAEAGAETTPRNGSTPQRPQFSQVSSKLFAAETYPEAGLAPRVNVLPPLL
jgi:hypothetical protein